MNSINPPHALTGGADLAPLLVDHGQLGGEDPLQPLVGTGAGVAVVEHHRDNVTETMDYI